ncbi:MAG: hypothetical protein KGL02_00955 [Acidobacteriota bacterium]|nr:hypothetical protein [Acidobacteriota bacterium]MDE3169820.1 hypothetical protein [Acidobacteriota bacterium]
MTSHSQSAPRGSVHDQVNLPSPTGWPVLLAVGLALIAGGVISSGYVTFLGALIAVAACVGWFRDVLPQERHVPVIVVPQEIVIVSSRRKVARMAPRGLARARLPLEIYPISAGIKGGLAGGVAMALLAMFYGVVSHRSIWYPINLLGAVVYAHVQVTAPEMEAFHIELLLVATALHITTCVLVGLLYGTLLPMLPRRPVLLGGLFAPLVWTGLLHSILSIVDPVLNQHIDWLWFLASQIAFGLVAGVVVVRQVRVPTWQYPFSVRAGVESPGMMGDGDSRD